MTGKKTQAAPRTIAEPTAARRPPAIDRMADVTRHGLLPAPDSTCPVVAPELRARLGP
jgi:hypothetical protein